MNREFKIIFDQILAISDIKREFVLGLSGGPDSICLLNLIRDYTKLVNINVYPVIIDHQIRKKSSLEAQKVKEIAEKIGFKSKIKKIDDKVPKSNIQNWARFHRRNLLLDECNLLNADLILGHHKDDQIETIFMRLLKGSGLQGLIGMRLIKNWQHFKIIRPLLKFSKNEILDYNFSNKLEYVKDVSNMDLKYERVFLRNKINLINQKISNKFGEFLLKTSELSFRLLSVMQTTIDNCLSKNIKFYKYGAISIDFENYSRIYENSPRFCALLIGKLINRVGGKVFLPKQRKILGKLKFLQQREITKFTLGNVILFIKSDKLYLIRESRNIQMDQQVKKNKICYFDNRFVLITKYDGHLINSNNAKFSVIDLSDCSIFSKYSKLINNSLPILKTLEGRLIKPYLSIISFNNINKIQKPNKSFMLYFIKNTNFFN